MNQHIQKIAELDRVIHEPGRLMIVALLFAVDKADFLYLQHETQMNKGTLSSHLSRLEEAGYIEVVKTYRGKIPQTLLSLTAEGRAAFVEYSTQAQSSAVNEPWGVDQSSQRDASRASANSGFMTNSQWALVTSSGG